jgi:hypothetical protein
MYVPRCQTAFPAVYFQQQLCLPIGCQQVACDAEKKIVSTKFITEQATVNGKQ